MKLKMRFIYGFTNANGRLKSSDNDIVAHNARRLREINAMANDSSEATREPINLNRIESAIQINITWSMIYNNFLCDDNKNHIDALVNTFIYLGDIVVLPKPETEPHRRDRMGSSLTREHAEEA